MKARNVLLGLGSGLTAGYSVIRTIQAIGPADPPSTNAVAYARTRRALEIAGTLRAVVGIAAFAFGPLARAADRKTRGVAPWLRPALYAAPLALLGAIVDLPTAYVEDYALERRFGLTEQTRRGWLGDYAKSALLGAGLMSFVATSFGCAVRRFPRSWPWVATVGVFPLFVLGNLIVPIYVMPLFNAFEPVTGSLEKRLRALATRFGVGDADILRMDMSRQTRKANAFVAGIGRTHRIVVGDTLINAFEEDETTFVVAHELGHYVNRDTWRLIGLGEIMAALLFQLANLAISPRVKRKLRKRPVLLIRFYATMLIATQALRPLLFAFSRSREWAADRFALAATQDPQAGIAAFRRLREQNLADDDPPTWYEYLFASHPSLRARIAALSQDD